MLKFQPFKRIWSEDPTIDFFEQFNNKLQAFIQHKRNGADITQIVEDLADDTFVKIMNGINISNIQEIVDEDLISSDLELTDEVRMQSALGKKSS